jgi:hypothetical protein
VGTLPSDYLDELRAVDGSAQLTTSETAAGHNDTEFSYSGNGVDTFTVNAGSFRALQHGLVTMLDALGYRHYGPVGNYIRRPSTLDFNISGAKQSWWMAAGVKVSRNYASNWSGGYSSEFNVFDEQLRKWQWLNGCANTADSGFPAPAGHRWASFWTSEPTKSFFDANPQYLFAKGGNPATPTLNLSGSLSPAEYDTLVELIAARLLYDGFTSEAAGTWFRTTFDPDDTNVWDSNTVYSFSKDVVDKVWTGTNAIHTLPPQTANPIAQLGILAYSQHRKPPIAGDYSGLYVSVTLQFGSAGYGSYEALVAAHSNRYDFMSIRDYWDDAVATTCQPMKNGQMRSNYVSRYDSYRASGARTADGQWSANWGYNIIGTYALLLKCRTGAADAYATARSRILADVFNNDPAVDDLFAIFENPQNKFHIWSLENVAACIDAMADGWYKTMYRRLFVIWYEIETLPAKMSATANPTEFKTADDPYWVKFPVLMSHVWAMRNENAIDSYCVVRRLANAAPTPEYPEYRWENTQLFFDEQTAAFTLGTTVKGATSGRKGVIKLITDNGTTGHLWLDTPSVFTDNELLNIVTGPSDTVVTAGIARVNGVNIRPEWWRAPYLPTEQDYIDAKDAVSAAADREDLFDSDDIIVMHNVTPVASGANAPGFEVQGVGALVFVGNGIVYKNGFEPEIDETTGEPTGNDLPVSEEIPFNQSGMLVIEQTSGTFNYTHSGGRLFLDGFPTVRRNPYPSGVNVKCWMWIPERIVGNVSVVGTQRLIDQTGLHDAAVDDISSIGPGQVALDNINSSGTAYFSNINNYISLRGDTILASRVLLEEDYPVMGKILKEAA